jgi:hypothetical protein
MKEPYIIEIRRPLGERAELVAEEEEMDLNDLIDYIVRRYIEDWEAGQFLDDDDDGQSGDDE